MIDIFTGYAPPGPGRPFQVCWDVSRPGENATEALKALQSRYLNRAGFAGGSNS